METLLTKKRVKEFLTDIRSNRITGLVVLMFLLTFILSVLRPTSFFTSTNLFNILKQASIVSIIAFGQTFVMVSGGIDLSVGYSLGLSGVITAVLISKGMGTGVSILAGLLISCLIGFANGLIITQFRLPPFIVTLGLAKIARGIMYVLTRGYPIPLRDKFIIGIGNKYIGPFPLMSLIMLLLFAISAFVLGRTVFGLRTKAIGGNESASQLSGINVVKHKILLYTLTGLLAGIAGIIMAGRVNSGNPNSGANFDLDSIAAVIVGGTAMSGGEGSVIGTLLGALILQIISNGLVLMNVNIYWQTIVAGVLIIGVCALDSISHGQKDS
ncbi:MAG: ABC transporter permease [Sphaerochaetaceae bacterium]|jgi:ribose transport system permease protein